MTTDTDPIIDEMGGIAKKTLQVFILVDSSGSMNMPRSKIESLNASIREASTELRESAKNNPFAQIMVQVIDFSTGAHWHTAQKVPIEDFTWNDISADGVTDLGAAIELLTEALTPENMGRRNLPPIVLLISDGRPTDDWESKLDAFNETGWGKRGRTTRVAIAIGGEADTTALAKFTGDVEFVLEAENVAQMAAFIKYATITLSSYASTYGSMDETGEEESPKRPPPPVVDVTASEDDEVW